MQHSVNVCMRLWNLGGSNNICYLRFIFIYKNEVPSSRNLSYTVLGDKAMSIRLVRPSRACFWDYVNVLLIIEINIYAVYLLYGQIVDVNYFGLYFDDLQNLCARILYYNFGMKLDIICWLKSDCAVI